jgi:hypothetical protein
VKLMVFDRRIELSTFYLESERESPLTHVEHSQTNTIVSPLNGTSLSSRPILTLELNIIPPNFPRPHEEAKRETYSFCASMITNVLSFTLAVDGDTPIISRKDLICVAEAMMRD